MNGITLAFLIILSAVGAFILYKWLKPYFIKHDTTITIVGGLGSGKSLESVKLAIVLLRKLRLTKYHLPKLWIKITLPIRKWHNWNVSKHPYTKNVKERKLWKCKLDRKKPMLYSNLPIHFKKSTFSSKREWAVMLEETHLLLLKEITEYSIILIDELPQFVNQFNWDEELVQKNLNEFITFFRHYIGGYFIVNAQSINDIVVQIRRKLNQAIWCFDFKKWCFGLFYTNRMCDVMISDTMETVSTTFIEDNTKLHFGLFPPRKTYDTRCYSIRYQNTLRPAFEREKWKNIKTMKVLRMQEYISPLDKETTQKEKLEQEQKALKLARKEIKKNEKVNNK